MSGLTAWGPPFGSGRSFFACSAPGGRQFVGISHCPVGWSLDREHFFGAQRPVASLSGSLRRCQPPCPVRQLDTAQRPRASLSVSPRRASGVGGYGGELLNARGGVGCSTPAGVLVGFTPQGHFEHLPEHLVLNARGRLCRVHSRAAVPAIRSGWHDCCSTPGGVFVGFTHAGPLHRRLARNSVVCSTPEGVVVGFTLRVGLASRVGARKRSCSTPEGVVVGVHPSRPRAHRMGGRGSGAQRPGASLSGSQYESRHRATGASAQRPRASLSGFTRLGSTGGWISSDRCSTPHGVVVGFTIVPIRRSRRSRPAQRPRASLSGSRVSRADDPRASDILLNARGRRWSGSRPFGFRAPTRDLLNARGRRCQVHPRLPGSRIEAKVSCSTPEGVVVGFTAIRLGWRNPVQPLLNARGRRWSGSRGAPALDRSASAGCVLNARGRRWSGSHSSSTRSLPMNICSTPEGRRRSHSRARSRLLNVMCSTPHGVVVGFTSTARDHRDFLQIGCSTPEGVVVGFTSRAAEDFPRLDRLLNARGRLRRVHQDATIGSGDSGTRKICSTPEGVLVGFTFDARHPDADVAVLNARGRLCRVHTVLPIDQSAVTTELLNARGRRWSGSHCGLLAELTRFPLSAQRPGASLSGSPEVGLHRCPGEFLCSTPEGVFVGFTIGSTPCFNGTAIVLLNARGRRWSGSPASRPADSESASVSAQRPRASWSGSPGLFAPRRTARTGCSTPEGVLVGFTEAYRQAIRRPGLDVLNARGRLGRVHTDPSSATSWPLRRIVLLNARGRLGRVHRPVVSLCQVGSKRWGFQASPSRRRPRHRSRGRHESLFDLTGENRRTWTQSIIVRIENEL